MVDGKANGMPRRGGIPRGLASTGPAILSYGFRPFFLGAGLWAFIAMGAWIGVFAFGWAPGGDYGSTNWHAHEMLFGYTGAALVGFVMTAVPNWTGRLPVSGGPLLFLVMLWMTGRLVMLWPDLIGMLPSLVLDSMFFPIVGIIVGREIVAGRNWRNLHILVALTCLGVADVWFHWAAVSGNDTGYVYRLMISMWIMLISIVGGRLNVSFTRNWLARRGEKRLPKPPGPFDRAVLIISPFPLVLWVLAPGWWGTGVAASIGAASSLARMVRWRGVATWREPLVLVLHTAFFFIPIGYLAIGLSAFGMITPVSALHVLTVGAIANMTMAVMTRTTLGHTGRSPAASRSTTTAYACLALAALVRPAVDAFPEHYLFVLEASAFLWLLAYGLFIIEYAPMLFARRVDRR